MAGSTLTCIVASGLRIEESGNIVSDKEFVKHTTGRIPFPLIVRAASCIANMIWHGTAWFVEVLACH